MGWVFDELYLSFCKAIYDISYTRWDNSKEDKHIILVGIILTLNVANMNISLIFTFNPYTMLYKTKHVSSLTDISHKKESVIATKKYAIILSYIRFHKFG